jgi:hypothetical protein
VRAPEPIPGTRIVGTPDVLDQVRVPVDHPVLRFASDEVFVLGDFRWTGFESVLQEDERGFVGWWLTPNETAHVLHHVEWPLPGERPALAQGLVAGVPARLWLDDDRALLLVHAAYAHELVARLP